MPALRHERADADARERLPALLQLYGLWRVGQIQGRRLLRVLLLRRHAMPAQASGAIALPPTTADRAEGSREEERRLRLLLCAMRQRRRSRPGRVTSGGEMVAFDAYSMLAGGTSGIGLVVKRHRSRVIGPRPWRK